MVTLCFKIDNDMKNIFNYNNDIDDYNVDIVMIIIKSIIAVTLPKIVECYVDFVNSASKIKQVSIIFCFKQKSARAMHKSKRSLKYVHFFLIPMT